ASVVSKWRCELVEQGLLPENEKITSVDVEDWTPERRFSVVLETATLSEMELADYCRRTGLFVEQVKEWRAISIQAHEKKLTENIRTDRALRDAKNKLRELEGNDSNLLIVFYVQIMPDDLVMQLHLF
ncbi:TPA: hypothetical protein ACNTX0_005235, partial [Escherichia coli]